MDERKLNYFNESLAFLGLTELDVIEAWKKSGQILVEPDRIIHTSVVDVTKANISKIKPGMIWYDDDTCSWIKQSDKKIKAVIELVNDNAVFGDLTVSELQELREQKMSWQAMWEYIENFSYPFKWNERLSVNHSNDLYGTYDIYNEVRKTFKFLGKECRAGRYWLSGSYSRNEKWYIDFDNGDKDYADVNECFAVRPVIKLELR